MKKSTVTLLVCLLASATFAQSIPQSGLVGWWRAEGNAQDSAGRHDGTLPFGMNYARGKIGQAFDFDGNSRQRVSIPDSPDFNLTRALTIEGWIYPRQFGGIVFFRGDDRPALDPWQVDLRTAGFVGFQITDPQNQTVRIEAPIKLNQWQHIAATFGARGNMFLFVNGQLAAQTNTTLKPLGELEPTQNPAIGIGNIGGTSYNEPFHGMIDEMALYSRALNQRQIRAIYNAGNAGGLVARETASPAGELSFREIRYDGRLTDDEAQFTLDLDAEASAGGESSAQLLQGDVAVLPVKLPDALQIVREGDRYRLVASRPGHFQFKLEVVAKIRREEPWNEISFAGPAATIASVTAQAAGTNTEVQLLNGTLLEAARTNGVSRVTGFLGADQTVALRWQGRVTEVARKALLTADSTINVQLTPAVIKYTSKFHYDVVQGNAAQLTLTLPATQALTRLEGGQIRDWHTVAEGDNQTLTIEFIKPIENAYDLTLYSEQAVSGSDASAATSLSPPRPLNVERESGSLTVSAEDTLVEVASLAGLRQVNAPDNAVAAYRFNSRSFTLALKLKPIEPVINVTDRVNARLEETRLVISHGVALDVQKAGIYTLELTPQTGFAVADVRGEGIEDWKVTDGKLRVSFAARVLGPRRLDVQLEQALKDFPEQISVLPLRVTGAAKETAQIGAASSPGIRLRTGTLSGLREIPVNRLPDRADEILGYTAEQPDWQLSIASEKLAARVVADVFNLVTVGDGIVGGSATIRYSLVNQGVQEFKVRVPAQFKNVEFTGPNIRRKERIVAQASRLSDSDGTKNRESETNGQDARATNEVIWTIGLQDKVWGGYTLVVTYDYPFDPAKGNATLPVGGIHTVEVERETGSIAVTTAANLQLSPQTVSDALHRVDEAELSAADRSFITRAVVLAWQYTGNQYDLALNVQRYATEPVLEAVADRTQITSVLTEAGEMLTQASFMVKNNEKQFQRFQLPKDAKLWSCYVNGQPAKPERDNDWVLVPLPRDVDRDQAFAVDIVYAQTNGALAARWSETLDLHAPRTDVPNTYAEWQLFVPPSFRLSHFGGSMSIAQGTTYGLLDAWGKFLAFYGEVLREAGGAILFIGLLAFLVIALVISAVRRGWNGVLTLFAVVAILAVLSGMLLPALSAAKRKAQRINSVNNLHQIGLAALTFAGDNGDRLPVSFDEMKNELSTDKVTYDTETGQRYTYLGGGMSLDSVKPNSVLAYSPIVNGQCDVLYADGSVEQMTAERFAELSQRGLVQPATPQEMAVQQQRQAIARGQFEGRLRETPPPVQSAPAAPKPSGGVYSAGVVGYANVPAPPVASAPATTNGSPSLSYFISGDRGVGGFGGSTAVASPGAGVLAGPAFEAAPQPAVAGIRSLRIELPQTGQPFLFTKVLNIRDEPLSIRARLMSLHTFQTLQMTWQTVAFLIGLIVWWWQWRRVDRNSFILTVALALIIGSVCSLLVQWRALHDALIVGFPVVALAIIAWLVWRYWPRSRQPEPPGPPPIKPSMPDSSLPPVMAAIVFAFFLGAHSLSAAPLESTLQRAPRAMQPEGWTPTASLVSASYSGTVNDRVALLDATLQISAGKAGEVIPLFGDDVAVQQFTVKSGSADLVRDGSNIAVQLNHRGNVTLQIKMLVKIAGDVTKRRLAFGIPPALSSRVALALGESEADVDFPAAVSFKRVLDKDKTRVEAVIGSGDRVELLWTPRVKRAAEVAATIFCQNASLVTFGGGVVNVRATLDYQITQGELRQARVQLPAGQRLLRVEGNEIRTWEIKPGSAGILPANSPGGASQPAGGTPALPDGQILVVDLLKGVSSSWKLTVETEAALDALPATEPVAVPHALDVKRETGLVALQGTEELGLSVESASGLERVDAEEFRHAVADIIGVAPQAAAVAKVELKFVKVDSEETNSQNGYGKNAVDGNPNTYWHTQWQGTSPGLPHEIIIELLPPSVIKGFTYLPRQDESDNGTIKDYEFCVSDDGRNFGQPVKKGAFEFGKEEKIETFEPIKCRFIKLKALSEIDGQPWASAAEIGVIQSSEDASVKAGKLFSVFRFSNPEFVLRMRAEVVQPEIEAVVRNNFRVSAEQVALSATIDYNIKRAGLFALRVALPDGYRVERVTGNNILQQVEHNDGGPHVLEVTLKDRTSGAYTLGIELTRSFKELPKSLTIAGVHPLDTAKLIGFVAVSAEPGVAVKTESFDNLTEIPAVSLPDYSTVAGSGSVLAYKFISSQPKNAPEWNLNVATETVAAWVRAEVVNTFTFTETLVSGRALVRYDIANAPVKELRVKVPAEFKNVEISGPNIRSRAQNGNIWRVELQSPTHGFYILTVTWDQPRPAKAGTMELTGASAEGVERETGLLAISVPQSGTPLQVGELNAVDLQRVDTGDFPDWAGSPDPATALAYRYARPGYQLALDVRRFVEAEVLQALVDNAQFTSVVADDGQMMTEMSLSVRNNGRQFLEIELPPGATNWSAFVAGQPVQPSLREGKLLLPIQQSGADDGAMTVELTYVGTSTFPHSHGTVGFVSPKFDVPLKNARWEIYLPPDYDYQDFAGTMTREAAAPAASSTSFSSLDYWRMEQANKAQVQVEALQDVSVARQQLASGNVREASVSFNRAKVRSAKGTDEGRDVKQLEKDLQGAQASNLINAQSDFSLRNSGQITAGENAPTQSPQLHLLYDNAAAEDQSAKLQQAQEIVAAQVQPLHVNLPVRGVRYAFTQVLQTETGKPMTIQMQAANTKAVNWPMRGLTVVGAFLILWGFVAVVSRVTRQHQPAVGY